MSTNSVSRDIIDGVLQIDWHTHCLPAMDDGAADTAESLAMLRRQAEQGVRVVIATPHFMAHRESAGSFLDRREQAYQRLLAASEGQNLPEVVLGAEIHLEKDLECQDLAPLRIDGRLLLLELPHRPYKPCMGEMIWNLTRQSEAIPVLAHIDRYLTWYKSADFEELFDLPDCLYQVNTEAFTSHRAYKLIRGLAQDGRTLLAGSDCHNMTSRPPDLGTVSHLLRKKAGGAEIWVALRRNAMTGEAQK